MRNEWFREWFDSPFYHKLYFHRDEEEAQRFIQKLLDHFKPEPTARMLDAGCGRGRHARFLAAKDFDVTGTDLSFNSIAFARQYEKNNLHFYQHDMRLPSWINYFDYAFNFFTSFGYFETRREHDDALRTLAQGVKSNGLLVIDYLNVHYAEDNLQPDETKTIDGTEYNIQRWQDEGHFYKRIRISDSELPVPIEFTEKVAKFGLGDFTDMFSFQKLQVTEVFGDYNLNEYDVRKTPRLIVVGKKL